MNGNNWTTEEYREYLRTGREPANQKPAKDKPVPDLETMRREHINNIGIMVGIMAEEERRSASPTCCQPARQDGPIKWDDNEAMTDGPEEISMRKLSIKEVPMKLPEVKFKEHKMTVADEIHAWKPPLKVCAEKRKNKYGNLPGYVNGKKFDSRHEAEVYRDLMLQVKAGELRCVIRQVRFDLADFENLQYVADFVTIAPDRTVEVLDAKSEATRKDKVYIIKKKLMREKWGIEIREV